MHADFQAFDERSFRMPKTALASTKPFPGKGRGISTVAGSGRVGPGRASNFLHPENFERNAVVFDLVSELGRSLWLLERDALVLEELLFPSVPASGVNAGVAARRGGSRPPVSIVLLDLKLETARVLQRWCAKLAAQEGAGTWRGGTSISACAHWLGARVTELEQYPWFEMAAYEIIGQQQVITAAVAPSSDEDPQPIEVGTTREITRWAQHLGARVSRARVRRWVEAGQLDSETLPDGRVVVRLADVLELAGVKTI